MARSESDKITGLLDAWSVGDRTALERLLPLVIDDLRRIACRVFEGESCGHTLQPTAVVNELFLRLVDRHQVSWKNRAQFFGFAAQAMRHVLIDHARTRRAIKRGDGERPMPLENAGEVRISPTFDLIAFDQACHRLAKIDPRQASVVEMRLFAGLEHEEIAGVLGVTSRTVKRDWRTARLWLHRQLRQTT